MLPPANQQTHSVYRSHAPCPWSTRIGFGVRQGLEGGTAPFLSNLIVVFVSLWGRGELAPWFLRGRNKKPKWCFGRSGVLGVQPWSCAPATQNSCLASGAFLFGEKQTRFTFWSKCRRKKKKIGVDVWLCRVVSRGGKWWIQVSCLIPGKRIGRMTHTHGSGGCEWVRLESLLGIRGFGLCPAKKIMKVVRARGHRDAVQWSRENVFVVTSGKSVAFVDFYFPKQQSKQDAPRPDVAAGYDYFYSGTSFWCESRQSGIMKDPRPCIPATGWM